MCSPKSLNPQAAQPMSTTTQGGPGGGDVADAGAAAPAAAAGGPGGGAAAAGANPAGAPMGAAGGTGNGDGPGGNDGSPVGGGPRGGDGGPDGGGGGRGGRRGGVQPGQTESDACNAPYKDDGSCLDDGSSNYADVQLEYSSEIGVFTGKITTNQCNAKNNSEFKAEPTCIEVVRSLNLPEPMKLTYFRMDESCFKLRFLCAEFKRCNAVQH